MKQQEIRAFLAIAKHRNISAAAEALHYAQPTVSAYLSKLETTLGKTVELSFKVDPACMGGVLLELPGRQLDGTVKNRLEGLAASLKAAAM